MSLALRRGADVELGRPVLVDAQPGRLTAAEAGRLDAARDADPDKTPVTGLVSLDVAQLLQRQVEQPRIVAAVVNDSTTTRRVPGRVRDLLGANQVSASQLDGRHLEHPREAIHDALHAIVAKRPSAAADEPAWRRVRVDELRFYVHRRQDVRGHHVHDDQVRLAGPRSRVGAEVVQKPAAKAAQLSVPVGGDLELDDRSVGLRRGRAVLAA